MPQIIVLADPMADRGEGPVMFRERVNVSDFESGHFGVQLLERIGWAVGDAHEVECRAADATRAAEATRAPTATPTARAIAKATASPAATA